MGYLLCSFRSRFSNAHTDEYGGSLENRMRLSLQVRDAVRQAVDPARAVGIRLSAPTSSSSGGWRSTRAARSWHGYSPP